jgi:putative molybdopterin biosynthesis protein
VLRILAGLPPERRRSLKATVPMKLNSEFGRTNYTLVSLTERPEGGLAAYPTAKGSGAVTAFSTADGFFAIPATTDMMPAGTIVDVTLIGAPEPADLTIIGSHCLGLDRLVGHLAREGLTVKVLAVGSTAGLVAAKRGECDLAGIHLMDPVTGRYNLPFIDESLRLVPGYGRMQGLVFRPGDARFAGADARAIIAAAAVDPDCLMVNRNAGSGTRILIDQLLGELRPAGYSHQTKSHNAVAVAIAQGRADWGVAIAPVAERYAMGFIALQPEQYDFVVPAIRFDRPAVRRFVALIENPAIRTELTAMGFAAG